MMRAAPDDVGKGPVSWPLRARETAHRRGVLVAIGALLVFSVSPVFGHHLARDAPPGRRRRR